MNKTNVFLTLFALIVLVAGSFVIGFAINYNDPEQDKELNRLLWKNGRLNHEKAMLLWANKNLIRVDQDEINRVCDSLKLVSKIYELIGDSNTDSVFVSGKRWGKHINTDSLILINNQ